MSSNPFSYPIDYAKSIALDEGVLAEVERDLAIYGRLAPAVRNRLEGWRNRFGSALTVLDVARAHFEVGMSPQDAATAIGITVEQLGALWYADGAEDAPAGLFVASPETYRLGEATWKAWDGYRFERLEAIKKLRGLLKTRLARYRRKQGGGR